MRLLIFALLAAVLCACHTQSYKETSQLAGTNWTAAGPSTNGKFAFDELQFGSKLSPSGMGQVRIAAKTIAFFQVIDGKLVMRGNYLGKNHRFNFSIDGDTLTLTSLDARGNTTGSQRFSRDAAPSPGAS